MEAFLREDEGMFENSHINNTMTILIGSKRKYLLKTVHKHMEFFSNFFFGGLDGASQRVVPDRGSGDDPVGKGSAMHICGCDPDPQSP